MIFQQLKAIGDLYPIVHPSLLERQQKCIHKAWQSSPHFKSATRFLSSLVLAVQLHNVAMYHTALKCWLANYAWTLSFLTLFRDKIFAGYPLNHKNNQSGNEIVRFQVKEVMWHLCSILLWSTWLLNRGIASDIITVTLSAESLYMCRHVGRQAMVVYT